MASANCMTVKLLLLIIVVGFDSQQVSGVLTEIVYTTKGPIQGEVLKTVSGRMDYLSFKGIPYAKPPIGELRFRAPVESEPWTEVKKTVKEGSMCMQFFNLEQIVRGSEDCLYLNVYTPKLDLKQSRNLSAVMLWLHGGAFLEGSGDSNSFSPDFLVEKDVLIVTCNYRLDVFGFLSLDLPDALGNAGLKDQNFVLRWVKDNIQQFGGDPSKVTLIGQSAGAASTDFHMLSDLSKGLFQQSISMSGSPYCFWAFTKTENIKHSAYRLAEVINNNKDARNATEALRILKSASAKEIVLKSQIIRTAIPKFTPVLENADIESDDVKFLTKCYHEKYSQGNYSKMPHMMGFTNDESIFQLKSLSDLLKKEKNILSRIAKASSSIPLESFFDIYIRKTTNTVANLSTDAAQLIVKVASDFIIKLGVDLKYRKMTETGNSQIYYYVNTFDAKNYSLRYAERNITELDGVAHEDDVSYLFYRPAAKKIPVNPNPEYVRVRNQVVEMFTNFAKFGNPTPDNKSDNLLNITWPLAGKTGSHVVIGEKLIVKNERPTDFELEFYEIVENAIAPFLSDCIRTPIVDALVDQSPLNPLNIIIQFLPLVESPF